ncbi:hypothetical protein FRC18_001474 [Serendipita sp. 400]|nr:hypothetical protein FRC18_001474 [Serendipita sp. 400]
MTKYLSPAPSQVTDEMERTSESNNIEEIYEKLQSVRKEEASLRGRLESLLQEQVNQVQKDMEDATQRYCTIKMAQKDILGRLGQNTVDACRRNIHNDGIYSHYERRRTSNQSLDIDRHSSFDIMWESTPSTQIKKRKYSSKMKKNTDGDACGCMSRQDKTRALDRNLQDAFSITGFHSDAQIRQWKKLISREVQKLVGDPSKSRVTDRRKHNMTEKTGYKRRGSSKPEFSE